MAASEPKALHVDLQIACVASNLPAAPEIEEWLRLTVSTSGATLPSCVEVSVRIVGEHEMRKLNKTYRGMDRSTNVLAFPADLDELPGLPQNDPRLLGDLLVCAPVVAREAEEQGKEASAHWCHMLVHGMLHLLGHDHETEAEAKTMEALEIRILAGLGLENPYKQQRLS